MVTQIKAPQRSENVYTDSSTTTGTGLLTLIELHNTGTQICLAALTNGEFCAMWSMNDMSFSTPITNKAFTYLCAKADANSNIWFDFELHDCDDSTLEFYMQAFPHVKHV